MGKAEITMDAIGILNPTGTAVKSHNSDEFAYLFYFEYGSQ
jgi:hypothetical protein